VLLLLLLLPLVLLALLLLQSSVTQLSLLLPQKQTPGAACAPEGMAEGEYHTWWP
jgi:hypothetical protein